MTVNFLRHNIHVHSGDLVIYLDNLMCNKDFKYIRSDITLCRLQIHSDCTLYSMFKLYGTTQDP